MAGGITLRDKQFDILCVKEMQLTNEKLGGKN